MEKQPYQLNRYRHDWAQPIVNEGFTISQYKPTGAYLERTYEPKKQPIFVRGKNGKLETIIFEE